MIVFLAMKIALAQIDSIVGDFKGNADKIVSFTQRARDEESADLIVFPELALCGYPPLDLLDQASFVEGNLRALRSLQKRLPSGIAVGIGHVSLYSKTRGKPLSNTYSILIDTEVAFSQDKTLLPTYDVFDEARYFESAHERNAFNWKGERIGIAICEDLWRDTEPTPGSRYLVDPVRELFDKGISLLLVPSASPYTVGKLELRHKLAEKAASRGGVPVIYINSVGANDSLVFDGRSFVVSPTTDPGEAEYLGDVPTRIRALGFEEDLCYWDSAEPGKTLPAKDAVTNELDEIEEALVLGIRGYMQKCGFKKAHLGFSGGIDSALVAYLCAKAIGADNLVGFGLPLGILQMVPETMPGNWRKPSAAVSCYCP
ncbi:hypothetical protein MASR2M78_33420 [Treponema sp.]